MAKHKSRKTHKKHKKKKKGVRARLKLMKERIHQVQILFSFGVVMELFTINYFKAILAYVLRFRCNLNENQAIMTYHLFQGVSYSTAYLFGIIMTYSPRATIILMNFMYLIGSGSIIFAFVGMPAKPNLIPYIPYAVAVFGVGHGAYKAVVPKVLNAEKASHVFVAISLIEMFFEFLFVGIFSMVMVNAETHIFIGFLSITILVVVISSFQPMSDPKHMTEKTFKFVRVFNCTLYGLLKLIAFHAKRVGKFKDKHKHKAPAHWLERSIKRYGHDLVDALIIKYTLHKFYFVVAGLWIGVELKYSYWIFASYLTNRIAGPLVIQPPQFLGVPPLLGLILLPIFVYFLAPAMSRSYYNTGTRQMCLGAWFILFSTALSWQLSCKLAEVSTQFKEPDYSHSNIRIINGHFCPTGIVYYFPMDLEEAEVRYPRQALDMRFISTVGPRANKSNVPPSKALNTQVNIITPLNKDTYLKYANLPMESSAVGEIANVLKTPTDSFTYLMNSVRTYDQTLSLVSYGYCETLASKFVLNVPLNLPWQPIGHVDVYLMSLVNKRHYIHFPKMNYGRSPYLKPGVRMYVLYKGKPDTVHIIKNLVSILTVGPEIMDNGVPKPSELMWLEVGDGPNLKVFAGDLTLQLNYTLGPGEMIDIVAYLKTTEDDMELAVKVLYMQPPLTISGWAPLGQYIACSIGEFLLGVVGLKYLIEHAPPRMQYFVFMDWYLMLGFANFVILTISQMPSLVVYHAQYSILTLIVGTCFFFIIVMASRF